LIKLALAPHSGESVSSAARQPSAPAPALVFADVYAEHVAFVWRTLHRLGVSERDLDDVCQEAFVIVHRKLATYDGSAAVRTWLFGIARRVAADHRRRAHVRRETLQAPGALASREVAVVEPALELARARAVLDEILDELDDAKRAVFVLFELEEMPMSEVARAVECPLQTAYSRLAAARKQVEAAVRRRQLQGGG
jgi:RNA polymerase sigma-70 factor (ECF subfamily)